MILAAGIGIIQDNWLAVLIAFIIAIFSTGGIVALLKVRPEGSKILVDAAQGAVVVQSGVIESLRLELEITRAEVAELRSHMAEVNALRGKVRELEQQNEVLTAENTRMEAEIRSLKSRMTKQETNGYAL